MPGDSRKYPVPASFLAVLSVLVLAVFLRTGGNSFITLDDNDYVCRNPRVAAGLTAEGLHFAFTTDMDAGWIPLTWLSRMADVSLFGMDAGKQHLVNVLFHLLNTLLLFLVLRRMTGRDWESAAVAALFGVHPLHVESVAWVVERKDVLAGFFWMLAMGAYARYAAEPSPSRYLPVAVFFLLGMMSKPTVVTLPFVLLLLDYWPLCRLRAFGVAKSEEGAPAFRPASAGRLVLEKLPLFALSAAVSAAVFFMHRNIGCMADSDVLPLWARGGNALVSCVAYLRKTVWPSDLAVFYPHPGTHLAVWKIAASALVLSGATAAVVAFARRRRWLATGWFWFLGTLVPVIGLVQAGSQSMADRYTYLPLIGVFLIAAWGGSELASLWTNGRRVLSALGGAVILLLAGVSFVQAGYWKDSVTLYARAVEVTENNWLVQNQLGLTYYDLGRCEEAVAAFRKALKIRPGRAGIWNNLGMAYLRLGRHEEGFAAYREALRIDPGFADAWVNSGAAFRKIGRFREAVAAYREAARLAPNDADAWNGLGTSLIDLRSNEEAVGSLKEAVRVMPGHAVAWYHLGLAYANLGRYGDAAAAYGSAVRLAPNDADAWNNLGVVYTKLGENLRAAENFRNALRIRPDHPDAARNLLMTRP